MSAERSSPRGSQNRRRASGAARREPPLWKLVVFSILATGIFFGLLELSLGLFGLEPELTGEDPYVGFAPGIDHFVEDPERPGWLVTAPNKLRLFHRQSFTRRKPDATVRVVTLGGSTTYGRPYGDSTSFSGWLREILPRLDPDRSWEVLNAGGISYASYRVAHLMEELVDLDPDVFVVYTGHNEFLEERTYRELRRLPEPVRDLAALASRTRIFTAGRKVMERIGQPPSPPTVLEDDVRTRLDASVGPDEYTRDPELRQDVLEHFRFSLERMVEIARTADVDLVLVTPASNLRHSSPFKSENDPSLQRSELARFEAELRGAREAAQDGDREVARQHLQRATVIDPLHAHAHYARAALDALGRFGEARAEYEEAREQDVCPLRALDATIEAVREVAARHEVPLVDFVGRVDEASPQGIPGRNLFLDHVHPTIEGHRLLAVELVAELRSLGWLAPIVEVAESVLAETEHEILSSLDPAANGRALSNLSRVLGWAGKLDEAWNLALESIRLAPRDAVVVQQAAVTAQLTERPREAVSLYRVALKIDPGIATAHGNLAVLLDELGDDRAAAHHYRQAIGLLGERNAAYRERLSEALARLESRESPAPSVSGPG